MNARTFGNGDAQARAEARYSEVELAEMHRQQAAKVTQLRPATERQISYLIDLNADRFPAVTEESIRAWATTHDIAEVSAKIDWLRAQPKVVTSGVGAKDAGVSAGRYAVTGEAGQTVFVRVTYGKGPFEGRAFVTVQAGDEQRRVSPATRDALLAKIKTAGLADASKRYGREIGSCGVCGRTLTDTDSREAGIGPVCAVNTGW